RWLISLIVAVFRSRTFDAPNCLIHWYSVLLAIPSSRAVRDTFWLASAIRTASRLYSTVNCDPLAIFQSPSSCLFYSSPGKLLLYFIGGSPPLIRVCLQTTCIGGWRRVTPLPDR